MFTRFKRLIWTASIFSSIVSLLAFTIVAAAPGDLDITFDGDGLAISYAVPANPGRDDGAEGIAVQTDGKIVTAGYSAYDFAILRYNTNGSLDTTFSGDGRVVTNFGGRDRGYNMAVQPNGKIVVSGEVCGTPSTIGGCDVGIARYNLNGTLDTTFSGDGKQTTDFGNSANDSSGIAIQSNGKIVLAGTVSWKNSDNYDFVIYRYLSDGSLDTTFSGDGMVSISFGAGRWDAAVDVVIQNDGKIVVAGFTGDEAFSGSNFALVRLNKNGTRDTTFSGDGKKVISFGADAYTSAMALQPDGKIVVVGEINTGTFKYFGLSRFNTDGSLDSTFNGTGTKVFSVIPGEDSWPYDVIVQPDGKIIVVGSSYGGTSLDFAVVRLNSDGSFDATFSADGKVTFDYGTYDYGVTLALQPADGKLVLGGTTFKAGHLDLAVARLLP